MNKILFDFFPLLLFFVAYKFFGIYVATYVAIASSVLQVAWLFFTRKKIQATNWLNLIIIVVFGGATIYFHNDVFVKWKPTVLYWMFALILLFGKWFANKNFIQLLLGNQIQLPTTIWNKLSYSWSIFFIGCGVINLYVAFSGHFSEDQWVSFKAFGMTILLVIFAVGQSVWLSKYMQDDSTANSEKKD